MDRLKNVEKVVEKILIAREDARKSDDILYMCVCADFNNAVSNMTVNDFFCSRRTLCCPSFASVTRSRRKVFENRPDLKPKKTTKNRKKAEEVYRDYALNS